MSYCLKCREHTANKPGSEKMINGSMRAVCATCKSRKCSFVKGHKASRDAAKKAGYLPPLRERPDFKLPRRPNLEDVYPRRGGLSRYDDSKEAISVPWRQSSNPRLGTIPAYDPTKFAAGGKQKKGGFIKIGPIEFDPRTRRTMLGAPPGVRTVNMNSYVPVDGALPNVEWYKNLVINKGPYGY